MINALIIDDEDSGISVLDSILANYCPDVHISGVARSVEEGLQLIKLKLPDLVFLDIEMPPQTGFDLLDALDNIPFGVIFTTAHNDYTIKAIRFGALDYLLKPIDAEDLLAAVARFNERYINKSRPTEYLSGIIRHPDDPYPRIIISTADNLFVLYVKDIIYCEKSGGSTMINLKNGEYITASKNIEEFDGLLLQYGFFRVHPNYLVSLKEVKRYLKGENMALMTSRVQIEVARNKKNDFFEALGKP